MDALTAIGTILGVAATLFFRDWRDGKKIFKSNNGMREDMNHLRHHYNDELTATLTIMQTNQVQQTKIMETVAQTLSVVANQQAEMLKYGVVCRHQNT